MHVVFRESHGLEETAAPFDPGQDPAEMIVLSFSDSDLGAFAAGWRRGRESLPSLRLCNVVGLKHPVSVDTYPGKDRFGCEGRSGAVDRGEAYWPYGLASLQDMARREGIALAVLPGDGREDARLDALSTVPVSTLRRLMALCDAGGAVAAQAALAQLALAAGLYAGPVPGDKRVPDCGFYLPGQGVVETAPEGGVAVVFYRSYLTSADTDPVDALIAAFEAKGLPAYGVFAPSLKGDAAGWVTETLGTAVPEGGGQRHGVFRSRGGWDLAARRARGAGVPGGALHGAAARLGRGGAWAEPGRSRHACRPARGRRAALRRGGFVQGARQARSRPAILPLCPSR